MKLGVLRKLQGKINRFVGYVWIVLNEDGAVLVALRDMEEICVIWTCS